MSVQLFELEDSDISKSEANLIYFNAFQSQTKTSLNESEEVWLSKQKLH